MPKIFNSDVIIWEKAQRVPLGSYQKDTFFSSHAKA